MLTQHLFKGPRALHVPSGERKKRTNWNVSITNSKTSTILVKRDFLLTIHLPAFLLLQHFSIRLSTLLSGGCDRRSLYRIVCLEKSKINPLLKGERFLFKREKHNKECK